MEAIGPLQLRVMQFIWDNGPSTVHQVHEVLNGKPRSPKLAYTTILTVMRNLARRGVLNQKPNGRSHIFEPLITAEDYKKGIIRQVAIDLFGDNVDDLGAYISKNKADIKKFKMA